MVISVLVLIGLIFLVCDALGKLPSWTWGLVLFLIVLGYGTGTLKL